MRYIYSLLGAVVIVFGIYTAGVYLDLYGELEEPGLPINSELPRSIVQQKQEAQEAFGRQKQILFGDTHVHTTYSTDAFLWSLPILNGEKGHIPYLMPVILQGFVQIWIFGFLQIMQKLLRQENGNQ